MITRSLLALAFLGWTSVAGAQVPLTLAGNATPPSGCSAPTQAALSDGTNNASGSASPSKTTTDVVAGSTVVVAANVTGGTADSITSLKDSQNNIYSIITPTTTTGVFQAALAYNTSVLHMPVGTSFTAVVAGGVNWGLRGAWISCTTGPLDQAITLNQATSNSGVTLTTGTLSNANETAYAHAFTNTSGGTITTGAGFSDLFNNAQNDVAFKIVSSTTAISYAPTWTSSAISSNVLITFLNSATLTATFDPSNTDTTNIVLSNGNLTTTANTTGSAWGTSRGTIGHTTGKYYWECTAGPSTSALVGLVVSSFSVSGNYIGTNTSSIGLQIGNGKVWYNGVGTTGNVTVNNADIVEIAADLTDGNVWWRTNNSANWNNSSTANPATNAGGQVIGFTGTIYPAVSLFGGNFSPLGTWVCNYGATAYTGTAPSGFGNW